MGKNLINPRKTRHKKVKTAVEYCISKIDFIDTFLELNNKDYENTVLAYALEPEVVLLKEISTIQVSILYRFYSDGDLIMQLKSVNEYRLKDYANAVINDKVVNENFLVFLVALSIGHLRGAQSTLIKNTKIDTFYVPFIEDDIIIESLNKNQFL